MTDTYEFVKTAHEGHVLHLTLNRPDKLNSFIDSMREDLVTILNNAEQNPEVRAILITGAGRGFCGGGDVNKMSKLHAENDVAAFSRILDGANSVTKTLHHHPKPTVAAINGAAAGGGANLALGCDIRIGSTAASFTQSFIKIGLGPDWGGSYALPRVVGEDRARELLLTGRTVRAEEALKLGLIHELVEPEKLLEVASAKAQLLAGYSPMAVQAAKEAIVAAPSSNLDAVLERERSVQIRCFLSDEAGAAFDAFALRKRAKDSAS